MGLNAHIGERIRGERERLNLSQQKAADIAGVRREMWARYEAGSEPGAKALTGMAQAGMDVLYILTGQSNQPVPHQTELPPRQRALLDNYENTDEEGKKIIEGTALLAAKSSAGETSKKVSP